MNAAGGVMGQVQQGGQGYSNPALGFNQPQQPANQTTTSTESKEEKEDPYEKLAKLKKLLDDGVISQEEFDEAKKKLLDL